MRTIIQRVSRASVTVDGQIVSQIGKGLQLLVGIKEGDTETDVDYIVRKVLNLRLFEDEKGSMWKKSVMDIQGEILSVSQFTLYAKTTKGSKPDFHQAMKTDKSRDMYHLFLQKLQTGYSAEKLKDGVFGAMMSVELVNEGPVTITIESDKPESSTSS